MKYFTPELYIKTNSADVDDAIEAEEEWERAIARYRRHYAKIKAHVPESVRRFHDEFSLHDAQVLGPARLSVGTLPWNFQDVVMVVQNDNTLYPEHRHTLMFLQYGLAAEPSVTIPVPSERFHEERPLWLYDEIDIIEPGVFSHAILLSNGRVVRLRFRELHLQTAQLVAPFSTLNLQNIFQDKAASA